MATSRGPASGAPRRAPRAALALVACGALSAAAACVDLFHSTDFPTVCDEDAAACADDAAIDGSAGPDSDGAGAEVPIDLCANDSQGARARAMHACGYLGACLGTKENGSFGECLDHALAAFDCTYNPTLRPRGQTAAMWSCLAEARSCTEVATCVFGSEAPRCAGSDAAATFTACETPNGGRAVVECGSSTTAVGMQICTLEGRTCARVDNSTALCVGPSGTSCTDTSLRCEGTAAVVCRKVGGIDRDQGVDCAAMGDGRCVADAFGVGCAPSEPAEACSGTSVVHCTEDAGVAESCIGGRRARVACRALGRRCNLIDGVAFDLPAACKELDASAACTPGVDECVSETALRTCVGGSRLDVDCTKIAGLGACTPGAPRPTCEAP